MKRCDLHIHTVPSVSDRMFTYDKDVLLDYVAKTKCRLFLLKGREISAEIATAQTKYKFDYELVKSHRLKKPLLQYHG